VAGFHPYLGDYIYLTAVGPTFYGIFSANNTPDNANFPNGVKFQRNANFTTHQLLNVDNQTPVSVSIDPFFFSITELVFPPIHPIAPIHVVEPIKTITPVHVVEPIRVITPVHVVEPIRTITPTRPIVPVDPVDPVQPIDPKKPAKPK
jgi:hypothetical protein